MPVWKQRCLTALAILVGLLWYAVTMHGLCSGIWRDFDCG